MGRDLVVGERRVCGDRGRAVARHLSGLKTTLVCHESAAKMCAMTLQPSAAAFDLEGTITFRDFGGWPTAAGGSVTRGRLFRPAHHASATPADLARLAELGIDLVVDLRRPPERERDPSL